MRKEIGWGLFVFAAILLALFGVHYFLLGHQGFDSESYLWIFLLLFPGALIVGYIFLSQLLEKQQRHEERLEHLVREVLHEINIPLATIEGNLSMLRKRLAEEERMMRRLERISSASTRLRRLYRELAYELKREIAPVERERFDLAELVAKRAEDFRELKRNEILLELDSLTVLLDRIGMEQVFDNLLENAIKYSQKEKPITVRLKGSELSVSDEGIGMDENEILRIYERYYQSDRQVKGEGIGLALVKRYCDDEGIGLRILSTKGEGTTILLDLFKAQKQAASSDL